MTGKRTAEHVRNLSKLPPAAQKAKADERAEAARERSQSRHKPAATSGEIHAVNSHEKVTGDAGEGSSHHDEQTQLQKPIPEPRDAQTDDRPGHPPLEGPFPFHDGAEAGKLLLAHMPAPELAKVCAMLLSAQEQQPPGAA